MSDEENEIFMTQIKKITNDVISTLGGKRAQIENIVNDVISTLGEKRVDYGTSFDKSIKEFGAIAYVIATTWKLERVKSWIKNKTLKNEGIEDTLRDIIGYTLLYWRILKYDKK